MDKFYTACCVNFRFWDGASAWWAEGDSSNTRKISYNICHYNLFFPMLLSYLGFDVWFWSYVLVVSGIVVLTIIGVVRRVSHYLHDEHERQKSES